MKIKHKKNNITHAEGTLLSSVQKKKSLYFGMYFILIYFTSIFLKEWKYGGGKKIVFEIIADSDSTTLKT